MRWGSLNSANTAPVVISQCTFDLATANGTTYPSAEVIIPLGAGGPACPGRPPGAFGWLDTGLSGPCSITTTLNSSGQLVVHGNTGNGNVNPWGCITSVGVNGTLMIPIYGASCRDASPCAVGQNDGTGNNNYYLILGFAEIQVTGWNLQHGSPRPGRQSRADVPGTRQRQLHPRPLRPVRNPVGFNRPGYGFRCPADLPLQLTQPLSTRRTTPQ